MPCTHIGLISNNLTQSGLDLDHTLLQMLCTHIRLSSSHLTKKIRIGLYPSHRLDCQPFDTIRFGSYPPHIPCTHIRLISSHLTQADRFGTLSSPHMPSTHMGLISSHLTKSGLHRTLHHMPCTHRIHLQPFDKIRFGLYPPPCAKHTFHTFPAICWFPSLCSKRFFSAMILRFSSPNNSDF